MEWITVSHTENVTEPVETGNMELLIREKPRGLSKSCGSIGDVMPETLTGRSSSPATAKKRITGGAAPGTVLEFSTNASRNDSAQSPPKFRGPGGKLTLQVITDLAEKYGMTYTQGSAGIVAAYVANTDAVAGFSVREAAKKMEDVLWRQHITKRLFLQCSETLFATDVEVVKAAAILEDMRKHDTQPVRNTFDPIEQIITWANKEQAQKIRSLMDDGICYERKCREIKKRLSKSRELKSLLADQKTETKTIHIQPLKLKPRYGPMSEHMLAKKAVGRCDL